MAEGDIIRYFMIRYCLCAVLSFRVISAAGVTVRFDPSSPDTYPFPSDIFTVNDAAQKTGRRINLPLPDCAALPSSCNELNLVNQLDGFSVTARVHARFSDAVDTTTVAKGLLLVALDNLTSDEIGIHKPGDVITVNQVVYDPTTNTVYAKPDSVLDQHRRYLLVVTDAVKDKAGDAVAAGAAYQVCAGGNGGDYCTALAAVLQTAVSIVAPAKVIAASLFTTLSASTWLENARTVIGAAPPAPTLLRPQGLFNISAIKSIVLNEQTGVNPVKLSAFTLPIDASLLKGVGQVAIGSYTSPSFLDDSQTIAPAATGSAPALPSAANQVFFNALLPDAPKPDAGYPVVIFGHGFGDSRFGGPTAVSPTLGSAGFAVVAINVVGHGFGPQSTVTFVDPTGKATTIPAGGRGIDLNGDGAIESTEGCVVSVPVAVGTRDCFRQTVVDLLQLVRAIQAGIDFDGDGKPDLDATRIYYAGESLGAIYGTILSAVEPTVRASALNVGGGSVTDIARWSPSFQNLVTGSLSARTPSLLNQGNSWNQDYVLRDQPVKILSVPGAREIQDFLETVEWLGCSGDSLPFAPHLKTSPLPGVTAKSVLFQLARGDQTVPNPTSSALIRAANLRENTWLYRHDRARAVDPNLPANPHPYLALFVNLDGSTIQLPDLIGAGISVLTQQQIADFFTADGSRISDPNSSLVYLLFGAPLFETPAKLPEDFGF